MSRLASFACVLLVFGCGAAPPPVAQAPELDPLDPRSLYPMQLDNVWSYDVDTGEPLPTLAITRVVAVIGDRVEVSTAGSDPVVYEIREEGIWVAARGIWLLRSPIRQGETWSAAGGRTATVTSTEEAIETVAGAFEGCVRIDESGGEAGVRQSTVYCPGVGPVYIETEMQLSTVPNPVRTTGQLRGYQLAE